MNAYVVAYYDQIQLLFGRSCHAQNRTGPESDRSEEPKFSASGRLQINDDFRLRDDHFRTFSATTKPKTNLTEFRPESHWSEEPKLSGSGRLQITDDFLIRNDDFGPLLAAGKPQFDQFPDSPETEQRPMPLGLKPM